MPAASSPSRPTRHLFWISVLLLLIFLQMITALVLFAGVFVLSNQVLISPFSLCHINQQGTLPCDGWPGGSPSDPMTIFRPLVILCLYVPLVLVAFALLAVLLAAHAKDRTVLRLSQAFQGTSGFVMLTGIIIFLLLHQSYLSWKGMTPWFYVCVAVQVELLTVTALTSRLRKRLPYDWE